MREHRRLARACAGDDEQRPGAFRRAKPILPRKVLLGIEIDGRARANRGERHGSTQPCFPLCSQGRWTPPPNPIKLWIGARMWLDVPPRVMSLEDDKRSEERIGAMPGAESHYVHRTAWLRAAVLGANDGIISTASLIMGVAAAAGGRSEILTAAVAGWAAGAMSMAAGEYVSVSSQADSETADLARERRALRERPAEEQEELAHIYEERGLKPKLAQQVADQLMAKDALDAHAGEELGFSGGAEPRPIQAAFTSGVAFPLGAALPTLVAFVAPPGAIVEAVPAV